MATAWAEPGNPGDLDVPGRVDRGGQEVRKRYCPDTTGGGADYACRTRATIPGSTANWEARGRRMITRARGRAN